MNTFKQALRLSGGLTGLALVILCLFLACGALPDTSAAVLQGRKELCEAIAIYSSSAVVRRDPAVLEAAARAIVDRSPSIRTFAVVQADGKVVVEAGERLVDRTPRPDLKSTPEHARVPIYLEGKPWGSVEIVFKPISNAAMGLAILADPSTRFLVLMTAGLFGSNLIYLLLLFSRAHRRSGGVSTRIRATLDTLVEGVVLMDTDHKIAMVNSSFARTLGQTADDLEGKTARDLVWAAKDAELPQNLPPWDQAIRLGTPEIGKIIRLETGSNGRRTMSVNATPIATDDGVYRGVLATFDDMTSVERKNLRLRELLQELKRSRAKIKVQNQKLRDLATLDALTGCLNRRALFERYEAIWKLAERHDTPLSCIMLDIDHFKSINDRHGHAVGDEALQVVSGVLRSMVRESDLLCRYGGEEFCVVLPQTPEEDAWTTAERFRQTISVSKFAGISATASFGVASLRMGAQSPHDLIKLADQALYCAKRSGRNQVVRYDRMPAETVSAEATPEPSSAAAPASAGGSIPYHAVSALLEALADRDRATAEHSRRVADLCVEVARRLLSERDCYTLEIAALLHDLGKLGIPDSFLKRAGNLTTDEWNTLGIGDQLGVEIVNAAFPSDELRSLIEARHAWFEGHPQAAGLPVGEAIPLGARILAIADAYDAMTSDQAPGKPCSREEAFAELRRNAGRKYDPELVEHFTEVMLSRHESPPVLPSTLSKTAALRIGMLIERLVDAIDSQDRSRLATMTARLHAVADEFQLGAMAELCDRLEHVVARNGDWIECMELTSALLDSCRSTQNDYLTTRVEDEAVAEVASPTSV